PQSAGFAARQDVVEPPDWREWYHWRKLRALHRHRDFPPHGTLTIESAAIINWDPLAPWDPESAVAQPGHMLPLVYRRLVELDVSDRSDAHRTLIQGDLAFGAEVVDATTLVFALRPGIVWA
ncbi:MAG: hypothetical protein OXG42_00715, partial [Chloroflexi bacterium]|nr:hypothetical protein [Chloroflexota bacterium]